jgi:hypothetical protein
MTMKMKENQQVAPSIDVEAGTVTFHFRGSETPEVLYMDKLHPSILRRAALTGMAQVRLVDAAAIGRTDDDGNLIPEDVRIQMKQHAIGALIAHYHTGTNQWGRTGGSGGGARSITVEAIARVQGCSYEDALEMVDQRAEKSGKDRKAILAKLRGATAVIKAIGEIRAERAPKVGKVDADAELEALIGE